MKRQVATRVEEAQLSALEHMARKKTKQGKPTTVSDLIREAIDSKCDAPKPLTPREHLMLAVERMYAAKVPEPDALRAVTGAVDMYYVMRPLPPPKEEE